MSRLLEDVVNAIGQLSEKEREQVIDLLVVPANLKKRLELRNLQLRIIRLYYEKDRHGGSPERLAKIYKTYLAGHWRRDKGLTFLNHKMFSHEQTLLHRLARLCNGELISSRQIQRVFENHFRQISDIGAVELSDPADLS